MQNPPQMGWWDRESPLKRVLKRGGTTHDTKPPPVCPKMWGGGRGGIRENSKRLRWVGKGGRGGGSRPEGDPKPLSRSAAVGAAPRWFLAAINVD